jgi:hypothetical protein
MQLRHTHHLLSTSSTANSSSSSTAIQEESKFNFDDGKTYMVIGVNTWGLRNLSQQSIKTLTEYTRKHKKTVTNQKGSYTTTTTFYNYYNQQLLQSLS